MAIRSDLSTGNYEFFHEGNHGKNNNPHPQYHLLQYKNIMPQVGLSANKWYKIATIITTEISYMPYIVGEIEVCGGNIASPYYQRCKFKFSIRIKGLPLPNPLTKEILYEYVSYDYSKMLPSDVKIIHTVDDGVTRKFEIYVKNLYGYEQLRYRVNSLVYYRMGIELTGSTETYLDEAELPTSLETTLISNAIDTTAYAYTSSVPELKNGWVLHSKSGSLKTNKFPNGFVIIHGTLVQGTITSGTLICTFPEGSRPTSQLLLTAFGYDVNYAIIPCTFVLNTDGTFKVEKVPATCTYISFSGISFVT